MSLLSENIIACRDCDLLQRISVLPDGATAQCRRCGHKLAYSKPDSLDRTLALAVAAAIALIVANVAPLMGLSVSGRQSSTTIVGGAREMWLQGQEMGALIVLFCTVVAPAVHIGIMLTVLVAVRRSPPPYWVGTLMRWSNWYQSWAMVEVMMLGLLVALIKIAELATVNPGVGMFAAGLLVALATAMTVSFDPNEVWKRVEWFNGEKPPVLESSHNTMPVKNASTGANLPTGMEMGARRSTTVRPRRRPSVGPMATQRTQLLPSCCSTSATRLSAWPGRSISTAW